MAEPGFVLNLPQIYKEIARELRVDTMDLRVYSQRMGRMWRVPNVERLTKEGKSTGAFKTPIDFDSFLTCTADNYIDYCSAPREFPPLAPAAIAEGLADLFNKYRGNVAARAGAPRTWSAAELEVRARWGGNAPPSLLPWLQGKVLSDAGWNEIAMQLAFLALALGWDEARMLTEADGLIQNHQGDGDRYGTPHKRSKELIAKFRYYDGDHDHGFTVPGLMSVLPQSLRTAARYDFAGIVADAPPEGLPTAEEILLDCASVREIEAAGVAFINDDARSEAEIDAFVKKAAKAAGCSPGAMRNTIYRKQAVDVGKVVIDVRKGDLAGMVDDVAAILPMIPTLRQRSGLLVEIHNKQFVPVDDDRLSRLISDVAVWMYPSGPGKADRDVLAALMREPHWPVPEVVGIALQPTITECGEIGAPEGFHVAYDPARWGGFDGLPDGLAAEIRAAYAPYYSADEQDEMVEALKAELDRMPAWVGANLGEPHKVALSNLRGLLSEFSFLSPLDESAALAAILTAAVRSVLRYAPAFFVTAHEAGTGKTFLAELVALFATPNVKSRTWPGRDEEQKKDLFSALLAGSSVVWYDNITRPWRGDAIEKALTQQDFTGRVLNESRDASPSTRAVFIATGNNVRPANDMVRRTITINLDAGVENPSSRKFARDPVAEVRENREYWVMNALSFLQAFVQSGRKPVMTPYGGFSEWSKLVRAALVDSGMPDPVQKVTQGIEDDPEREALGFIMMLWRERYDRPVTASEVVSRHAPGWFNGGQRSGTELGHSLLEVAGERGTVEASKLGLWLARNEGRVVNGLRFVGQKRTNKGKPWMVEEA